MKIDYSSILKADRIRPGTTGGTLLAELEHDRSRILFSSAFRRLQQSACSSPANDVNAAAATRSKLSDALQAAQVARNIAGRIAHQLEAENLAGPLECAALINLVETGCLLCHIGSPPFGSAGEAAIQAWFAEHGPSRIRAACQGYGTRTIDAADPRVLNALADFTEFSSNPQGLRVIAKLQWNTDPRGLNLTKSSIATYLKYLRMAGTKPTTMSAAMSADYPEYVEHFTEKAGFFSTEAGLVKNVWSAFSQNPAEPKRFPLTYIVEAATDIVSSLGDLEETIDADPLRQQEILETIKQAWLSEHGPAAPADPDPADRRIESALSAAGTSSPAGKSGEEFSFSDFRFNLIDAFCDYAARRYLARHAEVFAGTMDALLPATSGVGTFLATVQSHGKRHLHATEAAQRHQLAGYATVHGLMERFGILLACSTQHFQAALGDAAEQDAQGKPLFIERKLLSLFPSEYLQAYANVVAQISQAGGRDAEFEEWNARAHLVVDFLAGMTDTSAAATFKTLSGAHP